MCIKETKRSCIINEIDQSLRFLHLTPPPPPKCRKRRPTSISLNITWKRLETAFITTSRHQRSVRNNGDYQLPKNLTRVFVFLHTPPPLPPNVENLRLETAYNDFRTLEKCKKQHDYLILAWLKKIVRYIEVPL